ncbi:hypothetical protein [Chromobacterium violaceum]|uniref:hypothetical protein n=1 Tax=Chromobacterium violaceum TaxID=536 RepID=UPI001CE17576|nr:hypothetical protein [Chromobacterium violaceum]
MELELAWETELFYEGADRKGLVKNKKITLFKKKFGFINVLTLSSLAKTAIAQRFLPSKINEYKALKLKLRCSVWEWIVLVRRK